MSAYFYFSKAFIIILCKRSEIRKTVTVRSIQYQISSETDFANTLHRTVWSNSGWLHGRNGKYNSNLGKIPNLYFMGTPPQHTTVKINTLIILIFDHHREEDLSEPEGRISTTGMFYSSEHGFHAARLICLPGCWVLLSLESGKELQIIWDFSADLRRVWQTFGLQGKWKLQLSPVC